MSTDDNFFSRWSRRKEAARSGQPVPAEPAAAPEQPASPAPVAAVAPTVTAPQTEPENSKAPPPTLDDVAQLTPDSDFSRFVSKDVSSDVRNAAVKKLFADPHFNVMDGLDIYIDDYSKPSPLSKAELAMMVGAKFLKLVDDPDAPPTNKNPAEASAPSAPSDGSPPVAATGPETTDPTPPDNDHADLQLQPDHVPGRESPGHGTG